MSRWTRILDCPKPSKRDYFANENPTDDFGQWMSVLCDEIQELGYDVYVNGHIIAATEASKLEDEPNLVYTFGYWSYPPRGFYLLTEIYNELEQHRKQVRKYS